MPLVLRKDNMQIYKIIFNLQQKRYQQFNIARRAQIRSDWSCSCSGEKQGSLVEAAPIHYEKPLSLVGVNCLILLT